jgi:NAD(P) transhydrogenase subunit alpha
MAEGEGGYAKELTDEQKAKQQQLIADVVAESDVVITTAAIPGRKAPVLVTQAMVERMHSGSVIVDLAAERGGNCELTRTGQTVDHRGVGIIGPANLPAMVAYHASQTYARNVSTYLMHLLRDSTVHFDMDDQITAETVVCRDGQVVHPRVRAALNLPPLEAPTPPAEEPTDSTADTAQATPTTDENQPDQTG